MKAWIGAVAADVKALETAARLSLVVTIACKVVVPVI